MTLQKKPTANEDSHFSRWRFSDLIFFRYHFQMPSHHRIYWHFGPWFQLSDFNRLLVFCRDVFWTNLTNPKFLKEKTSWGRFLFEDVLMLKIATYQHLKGSLWRKPHVFGMFCFQNNQKPMKTTGGNFPQADAVSQLQKVTWRKSTGYTHTPLEIGGFWSWIPKHGVGNPRRYLWTNCRCHFRFIWLKFGGCKGWRNSPKKTLVDKKNPSGCSRDGSIQESFVTMDF